MPGLQPKPESGAGQNGHEQGFCLGFDGMKGMQSGSVMGGKLQAVWEWLSCILKSRLAITS